MDKTWLFFVLASLFSVFRRKYSRESHVDKTWLLFLLRLCLFQVPDGTAVLAMHVCTLLMISKINEWEAGARLLLKISGSKWTWELTDT